MEIQLRNATLDDVELLAQMNQQLIIDERSPSMMDYEALVTRMRDWLASGSEAVMVERGDETIGYLLYRRLHDEYYPYQDSIYVRQFFIEPRYRRRGIGQIAFEQIVNDYFPPDTAITLNVLETNPEGKAFWLKLGFHVYHTTMRRTAGF